VRASKQRVTIASSFLPRTEAHRGEPSRCPHDEDTRCLVGDPPDLGEVPYPRRLISAGAGRLPKDHGFVHPAAVEVGADRPLELVDGRPQLARRERRRALGQTLLHAIPERPVNLPLPAGAKRPAALTRRHLDARRGLLPRTLQITLGDRCLRLAVLKLQPPQLPALRHPAPLRPETLNGPRDLAAARGERLDQPVRDPGDLEVPAVLPGTPVDRKTALLQLLRERGAVVRAQLPCGVEDRPGGDRDDPPVLPDRARDDHMAVQMRVRHVTLHHAPRGRVPVLRRDKVHGVLLEDLPAAAAADRRDRLDEMRDRLLDGRSVRGLDPPTLRLPAESPLDRHGLRRGKRQVDPAAAAPAGALPAKPPARPRMLSFHQRDELRAVHRRALDPEPRERVGGRKPPPRGLRGLPVGREVVVAALRLDRLALQVARVPAGFPGADARSGHHYLLMTVSGPKRPTNFAQPPHSARRAVHLKRPTNFAQPPHSARRRVHLDPMEDVVRRGW